MNAEELKQTNRQRIGTLIAEARANEGLSVRKLADICGVSHQNITKIEHGRYNVSIDILNKVCHALRLEITLKKK